MEHTKMVDMARNAAADVLVQWSGIDVDWTDVRAELDAHWGDGLANLDDEWTDSEERTYRDLVASEIERAHGVQS